jgi:hypothetical protein
MKKVAIVLTVSILAIFLLLTAGCGNGYQEGKYTGAGLSMSLNEAASGNASSMNYGGYIIVELKNGQKVEAKCDYNLMEKLKGQDKVTIKKADSGKWQWEVVRRGGL